MPHEYFEELNISALKNSLILLDVDGTLAPDNEYDFSEKVQKKLRELHEHNEIFLCTNSRNRERTNQLEKILEIPVLSSKYRKPSKKILRDLDQFHNKKIVVIGDKFLTDYLFAKNIGAEFVWVKRKISGNERWWIRGYNFIDDVLSAFARIW
ncbi:HAD-IIIA family hydrolase [Candidatus Peregrinibacteria bacterium]|nr:HAD-IIIA family hydrolase [Candidatus Peregrinibacteria bacterium]